VTLLYKPIYRSYRTMSGVWYWVRRRFTLAGMCLLGAAFLAAVSGLDIENSMTYQAFALLVGFLLLGFIWSFFFRAKFSAVRHLPRVGTAGQSLHYEVRIKNLTTKPQTGLTLLEDLVDPRPSYDEWLRFQIAEGKRVRPFRVAQRRRRHPFRKAFSRTAAVAPMAPNDEVEVHMEVHPYRRGVLRFDGVTLARPDPLGIFRAFAPVEVPQTVLVLPKRYALPSLALPGAMRYQEGGVALATNIGRSDEFVALRDYRHGDPLRHIHWRSWARIGKPIVKEFEDEFFVRHALILDTFDEEPNGEVLEECVSVAASFACTILTQESLLDLLFIGNQSYCFTSGRGVAHTDQMLEILASVQNCADKKFEELEQLVLNHIAVVSGCICVFQRWDDDRRQLVKKMRAIGVPLLVLVVVLPGAKKPEPGPMHDEPDNFRVLEIGRIQEELSQLR
jgi:uncharacterized protein (DUF58 family)